jgi:hypothetical protein
METGNGHSEFDGVGEENEQNYNYAMAQAHFHPAYGYALDPRYYTEEQMMQHYHQYHAYAYR